MVPVPNPLIVKGNQEQIAGPDDRVQHRRGVVAVQEFVQLLCAEPVQHSRFHEEGGSRRIGAVQHLLHQIIGNQAMAARECVRRGTVA